jgi:hypothetical protein
LGADRDGARLDGLIGRLACIRLCPAARSTALTSFKGIETVMPPRP